MIFARALAALVLGGAMILGCAGGESVNPGDQTSDVTTAITIVPFHEIDVRKSDASPGLTVLHNKAAYKAFFGVNPPSSINFNSVWVLHYAMGTENTGGFDANIVAVSRIGVGATAKLHIVTEDVSPGPNCPVTQSLTNPQVTVTIAKQSASIGIDQEQTYTVTDCGTVQNWCDTADCEASGLQCDEFTDACIQTPFCWIAKCPNGTECSNEQRACVPAACDPDEATSCPSGFTCDNLIRCITAPCPEDYRCYPAPEDTCESLGWVGRCDGTTVKYCDGDEIQTYDCAPGTCAYSKRDGYYDCK